MVKRRDDSHPNGYLEVLNTSDGISISIQKDPDSNEIGNSIKFNEGLKYTSTYKAILELFKIGEESGKNIRNIQLGSSHDLIEIFLDKNGTLMISTKPKTIEIKFNEISKETKKKLKKLQQSMALDAITNKLT